MQRTHIKIASHLYIPVSIIGCDFSGGKLIVH